MATPFTQYLSSSKEPPKLETLSAAELPVQRLGYSFRCILLHDQTYRKILDRLHRLGLLDSSTIQILAEWGFLKSTILDFSFTNRPFSEGNLLQVYCRQLQNNPPPVNKITQFKTQYNSVIHYEQLCHVLEAFASKLTLIDVQHCRLFFEHTLPQNIKFEQCSNLTSLTLAGVNLDSILFEIITDELASHATRLTAVDFSYNDHISVPNLLRGLDRMAGSLTSLVALRLQNMPTHPDFNETLAKFEHLEILDLSLDQAVRLLDQVDPHYLLQHLPALRELDITNLTIVNYRDFFRLPNLLFDKCHLTNCSVDEPEEEQRLLGMDRILKRFLERSFNNEAQKFMEYFVRRYAHRPILLHTFFTTLRKGFLFPTPTPPPTPQIFIDLLRFFIHPHGICYRDYLQSGMIYLPKQLFRFILYQSVDPEEEISGRHLTLPLQDILPLAERLVQITLARFERLMDLQDVSAVEVIDMENFVSCALGHLVYIVRLYSRDDVPFITQIPAIIKLYDRLIQGLVGTGLFSDLHNVVMSVAEIIASFGELYPLWNHLTSIVQTVLSDVPMFQPENFDDEAERIKALETEHLPPEELESRELEIVDVIACLIVTLSLHIHIFLQYGLPTHKYHLQFEILSDLLDFFVINQKSHVIEELRNRLHHFQNRQSPCLELLDRLQQYEEHEHRPLTQFYAHLLNMLD